MSMECLPSSSSIRVPDVDLICRRAYGILFGQEIECRRREKGLTVEQATERAGMPVARWQAIEKGRVPESWEEVCSLGKGLGESRVVMGSLVIRYADAWEHDRAVPDNASNLPCQEQ
jgi:Helix-turn-helix domain